MYSAYFTTHRASKEGYSVLFCRINMHGRSKRALRGTAVLRIGSVSDLTENDSVPTITTGALLLRNEHQLVHMVVVEPDDYAFGRSAIDAIALHAANVLIEDTVLLRH
jgi:hypothetical protein